MKICFFCKISDKSKLFIVEFYNQDIKILKKIDPSLTIATKYSEIDWSADVIFVWWCVLTSPDVGKIVDILLIRYYRFFLILPSEEVLLQKYQGQRRYSTYFLLTTTSQENSRDACIGFILFF